MKAAFTAIQNNDIEALTPLLQNMQALGVLGDIAIATPNCSEEVYQALFNSHLKFDTSEILIACIMARNRKACKALLELDNVKVSNVHVSNAVRFGDLDILKRILMHPTLQQDLNLDLNRLMYDEEMHALVAEYSKRTGYKYY